MSNVEDNVNLDNDIHRSSSSSSSSDAIRDESMDARNVLSWYD